MSDRPGRGEGNDSERLPWLEPYRQPIEAQRRKGASSHGPLLAYAFALVVLSAVGLGGYWLGQLADSRGERTTTKNLEVAEAPTNVVPPVATRQPEPESEPHVLAPAAEPEVAPATPSAETERPVVKAKQPVRKAKRPVAKKVRHASAKRTQYERVIAKQREAAKTWPKMPSPGPGGQVIQLGAFSTRTRAQNAYRERLARYPVLSGMPQVIVPVITQPRGEILYVLRLGTQSREQSDVVCRNLRTSGDHCLVIG